MSSLRTRAPQPFAELNGVHQAPLEADASRGCWESGVEKFVCQQNIDHLRRRLESAADNIQRQEILRQLAAEEAKLSRLITKPARIVE
jgi:hypothetical protein